MVTQAAVMTGLAAYSWHEASGLPLGGQRTTLLLASGTACAFAVHALYRMVWKPGPPAVGKEAPT